MVGLLALQWPELMTGGYGWVQWGAVGLPPDLALSPESVFVPQMGMRLLFLLAMLKIVATGLTISSGGSGGVFGPSVFIGGMLGGAVGKCLKVVLPGWEIEPAAFTLVGMGGFFAGVSKTPLASIIMVCEMAGSYSLLVPLMLVCGLHVALSQRWTLYEEQVPSPVDSPAHLGDFVIDVLERLRVGEIRIRTEGVEKVPESLPFDQILRLVADSHETLFPVVDLEGRLTGIFSLRDVRQALTGSNLGPLVLADDLATRPVLTVTPQDDLHTALKRMTELNLDELPVVAPDDPRHLLGLISRRELVSAYSSQIDALRSPGPGVAA
jgi:CIC family chloride channel protein